MDSFGEVFTPIHDRAANIASAGRAQKSEIRQSSAIVTWSGTPRLSFRWGCSPVRSKILAGSACAASPVPAALGPSEESSSSSETTCLPVSRRSPLQGPHGFDRIGCRVAHPAGNRLVVEALHVLQGEFASRDVAAYLLDDAVMIDQGFAYPAVK